MAAPKKTEAWLPAYELGDQVETNALTATFRAVRRVDQRAVLIKTTKPGLRSTDQALVLLSREQNVIETTRHAALPNLLEVVRDRTRCALVFDDEKGHRLSDVLDRTPKLSPWSALAIGLELARALNALHRGGFVHGRLRLESIELTEHGALILHDPSGMGARGGGGDPDLDAPENMAPEQVLGQAPGPETDVYLLGKIVYQLVAGEPPFSSGAGGITQQIRHAEPQSLSAAAPNTPRELQRVVARCLKKRGRDRYPDIASLQSELTRIMRSQTSLSLSHLIVDALAGAGLATELAGPRERGVARGAMKAPPWLLTAARWAAGGIAALGLIIVVWMLLGSDKTGSRGGPRGIVKRPALVRLLARPWAEVYVDDKLVDVTPIGRPIEVEPGRHVVQFRHPNAKPVNRDIEIIAGQVILLDVEMQVVRPPDAGAPSSTVSDEARDSGLPPELQPRPNP